MYYYSLNKYLEESFGQKVYKLALSLGTTCPNRDGTLGTNGCIFCSNGGSAEFAASNNLSISQQIEAAKEKVQKKIKDGKYIAYFQSFTSTYCPLDKMKNAFYEAINHPDIVAVSIATRPDCLPNETLELLYNLNKIKPVWVELGLQTSNIKTAKYIRRGYELPVFESAVLNLQKINVKVIVHLILGLPGESKATMVESAKYVAKLNVDGVKLQLLHVLKGTDLEKDYYQNKFKALNIEEYAEILAECIKYLPQKTVIHRLTGDGKRGMLIAPIWSADKKRTLQYIIDYFNEINLIQGENIKTVPNC